MLVLDRDCAAHGDCLLLGHLAADEPAENAVLICVDYLRDEHLETRRCRRLTREDSHAAPFALDAAHAAHPPASDRAVIDRWGRSYRLERLETGMSIPELRWTRRSNPAGSQPHAVSLREVTAAVESYEPMRALTVAAVATARCEETVSSATLRAELARVLDSPIVLNRALREAVMARVGREEMSMSEIAIRCGRVKRDGRGNASGETSWLARRLGLLPEGGRDTPTPWIHSDVLGLIARQGLSLSPREVEL